MDIKLENDAVLDYVLDYEIKVNGVVRDELSEFTMIGTIAKKFGNNCQVEINVNKKDEFHFCANQSLLSAEYILKIIGMLLESGKKRNAIELVQEVTGWDIDHAESYLENNFKFNPQWQDAPPWANWWAMDDNQEAYWFENEPTALKFGKWGITGKYLPDSHRYIQFYWRDSLRQRPYKYSLG